jgi:predicted nucleic acid-binding protein
VARTKAVLDSNVFVAAGFNKQSSSAQLVAWVREGRLQMPWHELTREEIRHQLQKIPPLRWQPFAELFRAEHEVTEVLALEEYNFIEDRDDRKFAALAEKTEAFLVSNDEHLLSVRGRLTVLVLTPGRAVAEIGDRGV